MTVQHVPEGCRVTQGDSSASGSEGSAAQIETFYALKQKQARAIQQRLKDIVAKEGPFSKKEWKQRLQEVTTQHTPCLMCKKKGAGTVFSVTAQPQHRRLYLAKCGAKDKPCGYELRIMAERDVDWSRHLETYQNDLNHIVQEIVQLKCASLYDLETLEETDELFRAQFSEYQTLGQLCEEAKEHVWTGRLVAPQDDPQREVQRTKIDHLRQHVRDAAELDNDGLIDPGDVREIVKLQRACVRAK